MRSVAELEAKIQILENENRLLRERLTEAGISYADIVENHFEDVASCYDPDQGARIRKFEIWLAEENCERFAVIDKEIAVELLEMTFGIDAGMSEW